MEIGRFQQQIQDIRDRDNAESNDKLRNLLRSDKMKETSIISERTKSTLNCDNLQLTKIRQDIDNIQKAINKFSSNNILQFVSEAQ